MTSSDQTLGGVRLVTLIGASSHLEFLCSKSPMALFRWGLYLRCVADLCSLSWPFLLRIHPSKPNHSSLTHIAWLIHLLVRLESIQVHCFKWLHLEALDNCVSLRDSLVSLGGCHHLDNLVQRGLSSEGRWLSLAPIVVIVRGSWPISDEEPKGTLVVCSWLVWSSSLFWGMWSSSCVGCAAPDYGLDVWCLLACEPQSGWIATTGTSLSASKWTLVKNHCVFLSQRISLVLIDILWLITWHNGITLLPYGLGMWCPLACEPQSGWIATTGTSLSVSKWTLVKNHCVFLSQRISLVLIDILWLITWHNGITLLPLLCIYIPSVAKLFSVINFES
jgi:hypothetical protein